MKCIYCGEDLKEGCLFCSSCGKEARIVPDYNEFDDEYLSILVNEDSSPEEDESEAQKSQNDKAKEIKKIKKRRVQQCKIIIASFIVAIFSIVLIVVAVSNNIKKEHDNSYDYQVESASDAYENGDYESAIDYYNNAIRLQNDDIFARMKLAKVYEQTNNKKMAISMYEEVIEIAPGNKEAYKALIAIYDHDHNIDEIIRLSQGADESVRSLFDDYKIFTPVFSKKGGDYTEYIVVELSCEGDIYYSMDGADPVKKGFKYIKPISLDKEMQYDIKAVAVNKKGMYSEVVENKYSIIIPAPGKPNVVPNGGSFLSETYVRVTVPENCEAYYTWDMSTPTKYSNKYSSPVKVPVGNNMLSVILYDTKTGKYSDLYRERFEYIVDEVQENDAEDENPQEDDEIERI